VNTTNSNHTGELPHLRKALNLFWLAAFVLVVMPLSSYGQTVKLGLKINIPKGNKNELHITVIKNGTEVTSKLGKRSNTISLEFDAEYSIRVTCANCLPKEFVISTKNVPQRMQYELLDFHFETTLIESIRPFDFSEGDFTAAIWYYHVDNGEFDYKLTDYDRLNCFFQYLTIPQNEL